MSDATFASAVQALRAAFPVVATVTGPHRFREYVALYRSPYPYDGSPQYGDEFAEFLDVMQVEDMPYLPELAQLEWLVHCARQADDVPTIDAATLSAIPTAQFGETRLALHPSAGLQQAGYPVARLWEIHQPGFAGQPTVEAVIVRNYILVNRPGTHVEVSTIDEGGYAFLNAIARGATLGEACALARAAKADFDLAEALQDAAARRLLCTAAG